MSEAIRFTNIALPVFAVIIDVIIILQLKTGADRTSMLSRKCARLLMFNALSLSMNVVHYMFIGSDTNLAFFALRAAHFIEHCANYLLAALFFDYLASFIGARTGISKKPVYAAYAMTGIAILLTVISQFNDMYYYVADNEYQRGDWFWLSGIVPITLMVAIVCVAFRYKNVLRFNEWLFFTLHAVASLAAIGIQSLFFGDSHLNVVNITIAVTTVAIYVNIQAQYARLLKEKELEAANARVAVMLSQIQPHFLYNSLVAICYLCRTDPKTAEETVLELSEYLRGNLDSLSINKPISFEKELKHTEIYLKIEKKRFGGNLNIVYDIKAKDFLLPALTLQPIVENAVRHGITKKDGGGTVTVRAAETETDIQITVADDGVGFDVNEKPNDGRAPGGGACPCGHRKHTLPPCRHVRRKFANRKQARCGNDGYNHDSQKLKMEN